MGTVYASDNAHSNDTQLTVSCGDLIAAPISESVDDTLFKASNDDEILSATHDLSGSTVSDIKALFDRNVIQSGDTLYLGNQDISSNWQQWDSNNVINVNVANIIISGGSSSNPDGMSTINANQAKVFSFNAPGITLTNVKIINSQGGNGPGSALNIDASDCTVQNCIFENCENQYGGAVHITEHGTNTKFDNCNFTNNVGRWSGNGGAVNLAASNCQFTNCNFEKNSAAQGGAIYQSLGENLIVNNCNFSENAADTNWGQGGAIGITGNSQKTTISNSTFRKNKGGDGGAICDTLPELTVTDCEFEENTANHGGALNIGHDDATVSNCNFTKNNATNDGGAIYIGGLCYNVNIDNSNFTENNAFGIGDGRGGGAIYISSDCEDIIVQNSYFTSNTASTGGGAIRIEYSEGVVVENSIFEDNNAKSLFENPSAVSNGGGAIWSCRGETSIYDSTFERNQGTYGGALRGQVSTYDSKFYFNNATDGNGGAIDVTIDLDQGSTPRLKYINTIFVNNTAYGDRDLARAQGGALHMYHIVHVEMTGCECYNNFADRGGAVDLFIIGTTNVTDCIFEGNTAIHEGGGLFINTTDTPSVFKDSIISDNHAGTEGGAIFLIANGAEFIKVTSNGNTAERGGSTFIRGNETNIENCTFNDNVADYAGGGIDIEGHNATIKDVFANNNHADYYGAAINIVGNNITCDNVTSKHNSAAYGGSTYISGNNITIKNCTIADNDGLYGGGINIVGHDCNFYDNNITGNNASDSELTNPFYDFMHLEGMGGGVYIQGINTTFRNNNISSNHAENGGGGVYSLGANATIADTYAYNNTAQNGGFGQFIRSHNLNVTNSIFDSNHATGDIFGSPKRGEGGAFQITSCLNVTIEGKFYNNTAMNGSAIYVEEYIDTEYIDDEPVIFTLNSTVKIHDSTFIDNQAHSYYLFINPETNATYNKTDDVVIEISLIGGDNIINGIHNRNGVNNVSLKNVTYPFYNGGNVTNKTISPDNYTTPVKGHENSANGTKLYSDDLEDNQVIYYEIINKDTNSTIAGFNRTDITGTISIKLSELEVGNYTVRAYYPETTYYTEITNETLFRVIDSEESCDVQVTKSVNTTRVNVSDCVEWTIVVVNVGPSVAKGVVVNDTLPAGVEVVGTIPYEGVKSGDTIVWNLGDLRVNDTITITFVTRITVLGNNTNIVMVNSTTPDSNESNNKANNTAVADPVCDVQVTKSVNASVVNVSDCVEWTIVVVNVGSSVAKDVIVNDTLPAGVEVVGTIPYEGVQSGDTIIWNLGDLDVDETVTITFVTRITVLGNNTNIVMVNSTTPDSNESNNKANNTTVADPVCDVQVTKSVNASVVNVSDCVEWTIVVVNVGPSVAKDVVVNDTLPAGVEVVGTIPYGGVQSGDTIIWNLGDLEVDNPVTITFVTRITVLGNNTNIVMVNSTTPDSNKSSNKANNTTVADPVCDLVINKTVNATSVNVTDCVEWTIVVVNKGPSTAYDVFVKEFLPSDVEIISSTVDKGSFDADTRIWEIGNLSADNPVSLILVTKINVEGNNTNVVSVNTTTYEPNKTNNEANNTTVADPICDLEITKLVNASAVNVTDYVEWTIIVVNHGPSVAKDVTVEDALPQGLELINAKPTVGNYSDGVWKIGDLDKDTPVSLVLITQVTGLGNISNVASVNSTTPDKNTTNNVDNNTTEVHPICDLEIAKSVNASNVNITDMVEWTIVVKNNGPSAAKDVTVSDVLPNGLVLIKAIPSVGNYTNGVWNIGTLDKGTPVSLVLITQVTKLGNITNLATVNSSTPDTNKTNNKGNNTTTVGSIYDLEIIKLVSAQKAYVGEELTWTIVVTNHGPGIAVDVKVLENIPGSLKFIRAIASAGEYDKNTQVWTVGNLSAGSSETLLIVTEVLSIGNITNPVEVTSSTPDSNKTNNKANNTTEGIAIVDLAVFKYSEKTSYHIGDTIHWIITVFNYGPCDAHDVVAYDVLPDGVKLISYNASKGSYDASTGKWDIGLMENGEAVALDIYCEALAEGIITNNVNVTCNETDSNLSNNYDNSTVEVINETQVPSVPKDSDVSKEPAVMKETGNPLAYLIIALVIISGSFWSNRKE